ncbi:MAG: hypothetical protein SWE60_18415 [Thermodesulfobacteriota bacterium]|nr:hypothetical protein [Thermodesulfobacteriota bacterium]
MKLIRLRHSWCLVLLLPLLSVVSVSAADDYDQRLEAARRLTKFIHPMRSQYRERLDDAFVQRFGADRVKLEQARNRVYSEEEFARAELELLAKHFAVKELTALYEHHRRPVVQSTDRKMPAYTSEFTEWIMGNLIKKIRENMKQKARVSEGSE